MTYKAFSSAPDAEKYPHLARWYKHIASYESEFSSLPGDSSKPFTAYGPDASELPSRPKEKSGDDDDDMDLFGSDDEEDDQAAKEQAAKLAELKKKKEGEGKPKAVAKSFVTLDVKPWGEFTWYRLCYDRATNSDCR